MPRLLSGQRRPLGAPAFLFPAQVGFTLATELGYWWTVTFFSMVNQLLLLGGWLCFFFIMFIYFINVDDVAICFSVVSILPIQIHKWLTHYNQTISSGLRADPRSGFVSVSGCPWQALSNWDAKASSPWRWWHWWRWKSTWYILIYRLNKVSHWSS